MSGNVGAGRHADELAIRTVQYRWLEATRKFDRQVLSSLMTDDVVFLSLGRLPFGKEEFLAACEQNDQRVIIEATATFEEIVIVEPMAFTRTHLHIKVTPRGGGAMRELAGHAMSIFRRSMFGEWQLARDANLVVPI